MKKNILLIHVDQLRWDCLGYSGNADVKTPNIDKLAADGVRYTEHYTVYPVCTPSRYSLLSGMYVHQHGAWTNESNLPDGYRTFAQILRGDGYRTCAVGKMHLTPTYHDVGFDKMLLAEQNGTGRYEDDYHQWLMEQGEIDRVDLHYQSDCYRQQDGPDSRDSLEATPSDLRQEHHTTTWITDRALDELHSWNPQGGNLLMVGYIKPHHPFDPPHPYDTMYDPQTLTMPKGYTVRPLDRDNETNFGRIDYNRVTEQQLRRVLAYYYGAITQIDDGVGRLIAQLKRSGNYDNTIVVFTSDHGEYMGYHNMLLKGNHLYDPLAKIPLVIKYTDRLGAGAADDRLCENIDVGATLLSCCGLDAPPGSSGLDLRGSARRDYVFSEGQYGDDRNPRIGYMLRSRQYKLLLRGSLDNGMLFDMQIDPHELTNQFDNVEFIAPRQQLTALLCHHMLFSAAGRTHCSNRAAQLADNDVLRRRAARLKRFIEEHWE